MESSAERAPKLNAAERAEPLTPPVLWDSGARLGTQPCLPALVTADCRAYGTFFHGSCGPLSVAGQALSLSVRGAVLRGFAHEMEGTEGQDAVGAGWDPGRQALYLAVADGLSSEVESGRVARTAVQAAIGYCRTRPPSTEFMNWGRPLFERIAKDVRRAGPPGGEPWHGATTLAVAEVRAGAHGAVVTVLAVGDSELWALRRAGWSALHHERHADDNVTRALPGDPAPWVTQWDLPPGSVLIVASDGFASALGTHGSPLADRLTRHWAAPPSPLEFLSHIAFKDDYHTDDRAAVGVWIGLP